MPPAATARTILVVDDNITKLKVAIEHLQTYNFEILTARSGEAGLTRAQSAQPDLILMDVQMPPGIDGIETCRRLKANPHTSLIPVIFMSALGESADKVRGLEAGAVDYIAQPIDAAAWSAPTRPNLMCHPPCFAGGHTGQATRSGQARPPAAAHGAAWRGYIFSP